MLPATVVERARAALKRHSLLTVVIMFLFFAAMPFSGSSAMAAHLCEVVYAVRGDDRQSFV